MRYNDLFDQNALRLVAVARRGAISKGKPAITSFMVAKVIIINEKATQGLSHKVPFLHSLRSLRLSYCHYLNQ